MLSLIINTYPPKYFSLENNLQYLINQRFKNFEILIVNDGNDKNTFDTYKKYSSILDIKYFSRINDLCLAKSRNIGAKNSKFDKLVFIDSDTYLNPNALTYYYDLLSDNDNLCISGKCKRNKTPFEVIKINNNFEFIPEDDNRTIFSNQKFKEYIQNSNLENTFLPCSKPYYSFSAGNFGISKKIYYQINGSNENFKYWGFEDTEFAFRLHINKIQFLFEENVWADKQSHKKNTIFHSSDKISLNQEIFGYILKQYNYHGYFYKEKHILEDEWMKIINILEFKKEFNLNLLKIIDLNNMKNRDLFYHYTKAFVNNPKNIKINFFFNFLNNLNLKTDEKDILYKFI